MISPKRALQLVTQHALPLARKRVAIDDSLHYVLAEEVRSPVALPVFDNSAMDGYALRSRDTQNASAKTPATLVIAHKVYAGDTTRRMIGANESCLIMTGAPLPRDADTVIAKERAVVEARSLIVREPVRPLQHVRRRGEEIKRGAPVLGKGQVIRPGTIGCLATLGKASVSVVRRPVVSVITTGDETVAPGERLRHGQIYDSNSHMIASALREMGLPPARVRRVRDHAGELAASIAAALRVSDVLVIIGGVSVGDRDHVRSVLDRQRVREVFWRVSQKPGKPLYFGTRGKRLVFGLPGNPASAFTCFYLYVYPALRRMSGFRNVELPRRAFAATGAVISDDHRWRFLKGKIDSPNLLVDPLPQQGSHMITSLAATDGFIVVPPAAGRVDDGEFDTYRLPFLEEE